MEKCIMVLAATREEGFGDNTDKMFEVNLANGDKLMVPVFEIWGGTLEELKKEINQIVDKLIEGLLQDTVDQMSVKLGKKYPIPKGFNVEDYYELGVVKKEDLIDGKTYIGICRNATTAKWGAEKNVFTYLRTKFNREFLEDINHISDDDGYDLFVPIKLLD